MFFLERAMFCSCCKFCFNYWVIITVSKQSASKAKYLFNHLAKMCWQVYQNKLQNNVWGPSTYQISWPTQLDYCGLDSQAPYYHSRNPFVPLYHTMSHIVPNLVTSGTFKKVFDANFLLKKVLTFFIGFGYVLCPSKGSFLCQNRF